MMSTGELLAQYAVLLNEHGPDAQETQDFLSQHAHDTEFVELAEISRTLQQALLTSPCRGLVSDLPNYS